ncbi:DUF6249 domain-containing protein [Dysgonomonas sp. 521]|uniref:DUF6249 domain-containing protein n=1 Tax=Dysgonomonas sp. 521 TaxID=2302932 RepID=UPI00210595D9|nr:DUF6249 domain-containing protein [Dysgonomonas sp. 521]
MEEFMTLLIPILGVICIFGLPVILGAYVLVKFINSNSNERMELAKHGIVPPVRSKPAPNKYRSLRNGILCIGIALGLVVGIIIAMFIHFEYYMEFLVITSSTILFLGLSYLAFYLTVKDKEDLNNDNE